MPTPDERFFAIIQATEQAKENMDALKADKDAGWDARALSIAVTNLETAQLWVANARP